jgi:hypothetical protein
MLFHHSYLDTLNNTSQYRLMLPGITFQCVWGAFCLIKILILDYVIVLNENSCLAHLVLETVDVLLKEFVCLLVFCLFIAAWAIFQLFGGCHPIATSWAFPSAKQTSDVLTSPNVKILYTTDMSVWHVPFYF